MLRRITGLRDGVEWPEVGSEIDLPDWEAEGLQSSGVVEIVETRPASAGSDAPGGAVAEPAGEIVASPAGPTRKRRKATP